MAEPLLLLKGVVKDYTTGGGVVHALRDLDLTIEQGDFVAIVGTSGSGKSTLMNILGCLDRPTKGTYELAGIEVGQRGNDARAIVRNRLIGFIFQGFNLLPRTTALENVELPLQYRGVSARERRRRAEDTLRLVGLGERMDHTPSALSGGQQQRVAIARALVTNPPLLLADEPTGNLDTRTSLEVLALLQRLNRELGITVVLVTHEHDIAACAKRVCTFRDGRMVSDERHEAPLDAAKELAELPKAEVVGTGAAAKDSHESHAAGLGGPVPFNAYLGMFLGGLLGLVLGFAYDSLIVGTAVPWIPPLFSTVFEAIVATRFAIGKLHRPLTSDQRVRLALGYTLFGTVLQGLVLMLAMPGMKGPIVTALGSIGHSAPLTIGVVALVTGAHALLRYLILTFFGALAKQPRSATA
jgi:putative ABC transport system ATP-binding protein